MRYVLYNGYAKRYYGLNNKWVSDINEAQVFNNRTDAIWLRNYGNYELSNELSVRVRKLFAESAPLGINFKVVE